MVAFGRFKVCPCTSFRCSVTLEKFKVYLVSKHFAHGLNSWCLIKQVYKGDYMIILNMTLQATLLEKTCFGEKE